VIEATILRIWQSEVSGGVSLPDQRSLVYDQPNLKQTI
jgi:hypothetical protein